MMRSIRGCERAAARLVLLLVGSRSAEWMKCSVDIRMTEGLTGGRSLTRFQTDGEGVLNLCKQGGPSAGQAP
jgi:hypothetical protein